MQKVIPLISLMKQKLFIGKRQYMDQNILCFYKSTTEERENKKRNRAFSQLGSIFKYFADCANLVILVMYAEPFTIMYKILRYIEF